MIAIVLFVVAALTTTPVEPITTPQDNVAATVQAAQPMAQQGFGTIVIGK